MNIYVLNMCTKIIYTLLLLWHHCMIIRGHFA